MTIGQENLLALKLFTDVQGPHRWKCQYIVICTKPVPRKKKQITKRYLNSYAKSDNLPSPQKCIFRVVFFFSHAPL
jgi:hypothetical protein